MNLPYKRPESVLVVIYTARPEVLLLHRSDMPEYWQSVTGSLEDRETVILNPDEHSRSLWLPKNEALNKVSSSTNRNAIEQFIPAGEAGFCKTI